MGRIRQSVVKPVAFLGSLAGIILGVMAVASAQTPLPGIGAPPAPPKPAPKLEIDLARFLMDQMVFSAPADEPVWDLQPQPGRRFVLVPINIRPIGQIAELDRPDIEIKSARFVCWYVPKTEKQERAESDRNLFAQDGGFDLGGATQPDQPAAVLGPIKDDQGEAVPALPEDAPRLVREFTVYPDGRVIWELSRTFGGVEVKDGTDRYQLKLRPDRLRELEPERPDPVRRNSGESARDFAKRRREAQQAYREKQLEYRELRRTVVEAPDRFGQMMPPVVWAVFEINEVARFLEFEGPDLKWTLRLEQLQAIRENVDKRISGDGPSSDDSARINKMRLAAQDNHRMTHLMIAMSLRSAEQVGKSRPGDPLYELIKTIIQGPSSTARTMMLRDLAATVPPTAATMQLLKFGGSHLTSEMKLTALQSSLAGNEQVQRPAEVVAQAWGLMRDPNGPNAGVVLEAVAEKLAQSPEGRGLLLSSIDLGSLPDDRRDQAIAYIIRSSPTSKLSADWLNYQLIGSANPALAKRSLELLSRASAGASIVGPVSRSLMSMLFAPTSDSHEATSPATLDLTLTDPIPLRSTNHSIFRVLNSADPGIRHLAWDVLRHFVLVDAGAGSNQMQGVDPLEMVVASALGQADTPDQIVTFLERQQDQTRATGYLVQLVMRGDNGTRTRAARALLASGRDIKQHLDKLTSEDRGYFVDNLYLRLQGEAPPVIQLIRDSESRAGVVTWFSNVLTNPDTGHLPTPKEWSGAYASEEALLTAAGLADEQVRTAAAAALLGRIGGEPSDVQSLADAFNAESDRTLENLRDLWVPIKQEVYARQLAKAAGRYRLVVLIGTQATDPLGQPAESTSQPVRLILGTIDLVADGQQVKLANGSITLSVAEQRLAIRMDKPTDLTQFENQQLSDLNLQLVDQPIDLVPQEDGSWQGQTFLAGGRTMTVRFEPVAAE